MGEASEGGSAGVKSGIKLSRRKFLVTTGLAAVAAVAHKPIEASRTLFEINQGYVTGETNTGSITSETPKHIRKEDIPPENEWLKNADKVLSSGIAIYQHWRKGNPDLPSPHYQKPENYLDVPSVAVNLKKQIPHARGEPGNPDFFRNLLIDCGVEKFDKPYARFIGGSGANITSLQELISTDPGTGVVRNIRYSMSEKFGSEFDVFRSCVSNSLTEEQHKFIADQFHDWYFGAMNYVEDARAKSSEPISTSVLFAFFLHQNQGDILSSAWDTSVWLKILARNDPEDGLKRDPNYDRAHLATRIFKDEFSPHLSANWVVDHVGRDDGGLNFVGDPYKMSEYKDFMPANRAGGFYHAWNIIALSMCMSPFFIKRATATYDVPITWGSGFVFSEYGREKNTADLLVAKRAHKIKGMLRKYS
ncbi:MAG: hypothetical protein WC841_04455 [Candidatus Shapirobacteria bacterium]|jgi:hypothetical protein